ncbi:hypothetical protein TNCV_4405361 [Trichonephila clavipes]|uniref:Tc1-like transposase DDE domain-containing protein n=1 Tax=Trichonephila clavipes TaxID=2585209 RepID=A0A8X6VAX8_TRICX|nr:hypothetical protein TNCV_4405361 [Trichonephila clavipes]
MTRSATHYSSPAKPYVSAGKCTTTPVDRIVQTFLNTKNVRMLPWPAHSPDLSSIQKVWSMVVERQARHHTPATTVHELCHRVQAA